MLGVSLRLSHAGVSGVRLGRGHFGLRAFARVGLRAMPLSNIWTKLIGDMGRKVLDAEPGALLFPVEDWRHRLELVSFELLDELRDPEVGGMSSLLAFEGLIHLATPNILHPEEGVTRALWFGRMVVWKADGWHRATTSEEEVDRFCRISLGVGSDSSTCSGFIG